MDIKKKILVVDDEVAVRRILKTRLTMVGYEVVTAADGEEALEVFASEQPDLIVLDVMMPRRDGYFTCQELRKSSDVPIIMLTALGDVADRISGLQLGADDYLVKPFSPKELEARIRTVLRRFKREDVPRAVPTGTVHVGRLVLDTNKRSALLDDQPVRLTGREYNLLRLLVSNSGRSLSRAEILQSVWGYEPRRHSDLRVVDVHVSRLRGKIEEDPKHPELIITDRGTGYLFQRIASVPEPARA
ncbi:two component transcriptional regulator, winged-helix family [Rubidibacter lacunae KORDI 51-2]|uniref:Probable transcriptional regulator ycf27 n=1 Tax=Rubidibacter lacunae KORDI 51-2 TaxID=582515 RepID=U5DE74_9CHRO|nr:response regulator transcription factor [Rubidibacter lacunae]ERN42808.1 two component transcriptional regulator, winged-helix family [Rubidibacter lacunae KORDI 51-2]